MDLTASAAPLISVVTGVWNTDPDILAACIDSVLGQGYRSWELCLVDDGSTRPGVAALLDDYGTGDERIKVRHRKLNGGISTAQNEALAMASGEFVALLDHDDELTPDALGAVAQEIATHPDVDVIYTDEALTTAAGECLGVARKPGWSPEYLLGANYVNHLTVYRKAVVMEAGGFREDLIQAQDWDLLFRVTSTTDRVRHIPKALYRCRNTPGSAGKLPVAPPTWTRALSDHLARRGDGGVVEAKPVPGLFDVRFPIAGDPLVSILVVTSTADSTGTSPSRRWRAGDDTALVDGFMQPLVDKTAYEPFEVICVVDRTSLAPVKHAAAVLAPRVRCLGAPEGAGFSQRVNQAALLATGEYLVVMDPDVEVVDGEWIGALLELCQLRGIGAVAPPSVTRDDTFSDAGVGFQDCLPYPAYQGTPAHYPGPPGASITVARNYLAVDGGGMMTPRRVFFEAGGFCTQFSASLAGIDYCLKLGTQGLRSVVTPRTRLLRRHPATTTPGGAEAVRFRAYWQGIVERDPFHSMAWDRPAPPVPVRSAATAS